MIGFVSGTRTWLMRRFWDVHSRGWEQVASGDEAASRRGDLADALCALVPQGARVVDLGCGAGHLAVHLAQRGMAVTAADFSPAMLERARRRAEDSGVSITFERVDLDQALPWPAGAFDAVVSVYAIQMLRDAASFLVEAGRLVQESGVVVIEAPAGPSSRLSVPAMSPRDRVLNEMKRAAARMPGGVNWLDDEALRGAALRAGLFPDSISTRDASARLIARPATP